MSRLLQLAPLRSNVTSMDKMAREFRAKYPAPDGTALGNLRHSLAATAESPDSDMILRVSGNIYEADEPGVTTNAGGQTFTGLTLGDLRELASLLDVRV